MKTFVSIAFPLWLNLHRPLLQLLQIVLNLLPLQPLELQLLLQSLKPLFQILLGRKVRAAEQHMGETRERLTADVVAACSDGIAGRPDNAADGIMPLKPPPLFDV